MVSTLAIASSIELIAALAPEAEVTARESIRITSYNVCYTKLLRAATDLFAELRTVNDGETAFESLETKPVSVIFCWQEKIALDSLLWLRSLQKRDEHADIPVLVLCDAVEANERILALDLGASDCIS